MVAWASALVQLFEGLHDGDKKTPLLEPQQDAVGIWTLGWGSIFDFSGRRVTAETPAITHAEADALLDRDFGRALEAAVKLSAPRSLTEFQVAALGDFIFNAGAGAYRGSTARARVREGADGEVPAMLARFRFAAGRELPGLHIRRLAEGEIYQGMPIGEVVARVRLRQRLARAKRPYVEI